MSNESAALKPLHAYAAESITLGEALRVWAADACRQTRATALLYEPTRCVVALLHADGRLTDHRERTADAAGVYEARCFTPDAELRFVRDDEDRGRAVSLGESAPGQVLRERFSSDVSLRFEEIVETTYLLWGQGEQDREGEFNPAPGWSRLCAARIGVLDVPAIVAPGRGCLLHAREYVGADLHGNAEVVEERLLALQEAGDSSDTPDMGEGQDA